MLEVGRLAVATIQLLHRRRRDLEELLWDLRNNFAQKASEIDELLSSLVGV
ncbi:MAG TPA: hypothetical protein VNE62_03795 [Actinomycetota bacterium]|nr:hypothetical protein [Actinomycetota bacterium]